MNYIIFGATSGIAIELINLIKKKDKNRKVHFFLSSRSKKNLNRLVSKLNLSNDQYDLLAIDLAKNKIDLEIVKKKISKYLKDKNYIYYFPSKPSLTEGKYNPRNLDKILNVNFNSFIKIFNYLINDFSKTQVITHISTISCIRPKSKNYIYAASKFGIENYLMSLMHYYKFQKPYIQIFRIGFINDLNEPKTFVKKLLSSSSKFIAKYIYEKNQKPISKLFYYPKISILLKNFILLIPRFLYKRINY